MVEGCTTADLVFLTEAFFFEIRDGDTGRNTAGLTVLVGAFFCSMRDDMSERRWDVNRQLGIATPCS
jgi:hypothetical protein